MPVENAENSPQKKRDRKNGEKRSDCREREKLNLGEGRKRRQLGSAGRKKLVLGATHRRSRFAPSEGGAVPWRLEKELPTNPES